MADVQETKSKYHRGACFSCRKCMFVELIYNKKNVIATCQMCQIE
ncbi:18114_t:CDS:1, partial [Dentiscutata erythropus]